MALMTEKLIRYKPIPVKKSTHKAGLSAHAHRWFRLTPSYGPDLVREMIKELHCKKDEVILDPFCGASTTLIESKLEGYDCYGFEINPLLHWVGKTSTHWALDIAQLEKDKLDIVSQFNEQSSHITFDTLEENNLFVPPIYLSLIHI